MSLSPTAAIHAPSGSQPIARHTPSHGLIRRASPAWTVGRGVFGIHLDDLAVERLGGGGLVALEEHLAQGVQGGDVVGHQGEHGAQLFLRFVGARL